MTTPELGGPPEEEPTIGRLIADTTRDFSTLVHDEIELAKTELKVSVRAGGISIGLFGGAVFLILLSIVMISFAFALFLDWLFAGTATSFLIVFVVYVLVAALLAWIGSKKIKQVKPPEQTIESVKETTQVLKRSEGSVHLPATVDNPDIELPGPWSHRYISANGARFHVCESLPDPTSASAPLVVLLHGFPEFWWAWRHQLPVLAAAGFHAVAMDLRGYGASDKTPRGYDPLTLAADVTGVIRSMGSRSAVVVGHGWGGFVGWAAAAQRPDCVSALCAVSAPHPRLLTSARRWVRPGPPVRHLLAMQVPWLPERRIARGPYVADHLAAWAAPDGEFPSEEEVRRYRAAFALWPSPHCALEYHRWLFRSRLRRDGRAFARVLRRQVAVPVMQVSGRADPAEPARAAQAAARYVRGPLSECVIEGAGHFPHEERAEEFNRLLLGWLSGSAGTGRDAAG